MVDAVDADEAGSAAAAGFTHRQILVIFLGLMSGMLLAALDQTIVSTALPTIVGELGGLEKLSWVVTAYLLTSTTSTPLYGKLSDLYGRKLLFQAAIVIFLVGSVLAGLSQSMVQLIAFRGLQGIGGGGLMAMAFAVMGEVVSPRERGRYTGYLTSVFGFSSVVGPLVGGFFVDRLSWRWVFYINVPVGIAALFVTSAVLHLPVHRERHRVDFEGAALLVGGVSTLLLVLVWGGVEYPWTSPTIIGLGGTAALLLGAFVLWEIRVAEPLLPLRLFREPIFAICTALALLIGAAMFCTIVFLPLYLQAVRGASATASEFLVLPLMAGMITTSIASGRIISRTGRYKVWLVAGLALTTVAMFMLSRLTSGTPKVVALGEFFLIGLGIGGVMQVMILAVQNAVPYRDLGVGTSAVNFFRSMGGSLGVAIFGAVLSTRLAHELAHRLPRGAAAGLKGGAGSLLSSPERIHQLPPAVAHAVTESLAASLQTVFLCAVPLVAIGFLLSWRIKEIPLRDTAHVGAALIE